MKIGIPKEIKNNENRVGMTPAGVSELIKHGHSVYVQKTAGEGSGFTDDMYLSVGAQILPSIEDVYATADMIIKVKEPISPEYPLIRKGQLVFTYFHFACSRELTEAMVKSGGVCLAYETVQLADGSLPLLVPMSEIAGRMATINGTYYLQKTKGGKGKLICGVPGVMPTKVVVIGGGIVGQAAAESQPDVVVEINSDSSEYSSGQKADIGYKVYSNIMDPGIEVRNVYITASADEKLSEVGVEGGTEKIDMLEFGTPAESSAAVKSGDSEEPQFTLTENNSAEASYSETEEKGTPVWIFWLAVASAAAVLAAVIAFKKKRAKASFMLAAIIFCASASDCSPAIISICGTDNRVT